MTLPAIRAPQEMRSRENFPVALRVLPAKLRRDLHALYDYARYLDDLGDEPAPELSTTGRLAALNEFEAHVRDLHAGRPVQHPVLRGLAPAVHDRHLPLPPLLRLVQANRVDQHVTRYATFDQLVSYCALSANPVGELVLHVFGQASPQRVGLSDRICTALQIVEHLQDVAEDHRRGRIYLPATDLDRFGVAEDDLARPVASQPLRNLMAFQAERARIWLESGAALVPALRGWGRLAVGGYLAGGRAALAALARARYDPLAAAPKARRGDVLVQWVAASLRGLG